MMRRWKVGMGYAIEWLEYRLESEYMNSPEITVKFVEEQGFSAEVVNIFARTSVAAITLKELIAEREAARLARKIARERQILSLSC